ncbi:Uncharacterised protein [Weissella viridescens]|uniref:Uncharacterized protein n=1 Tax=Weissella viridescens TaxID=1629 RepID=A0A380P7E7_WEIVI|nr:Uncharacterised protein [Weissella viridescens]
MKQYLHTTFGSQKVLQALQTENPERHMLLTIDDRDQNNFNYWRLLTRQRQFLPIQLVMMCSVLLEKLMTFVGGFILLS